MRVRKMVAAVLQVGGAMMACAQSEVVSVTDWRVHAGDDPSWAGIDLDDSAWARNHAVTGRTGGGFITVCCARFFPDGRVVIANAGHISPYLAGREVQMESGLPLGIILQTSYCETEIETHEAIVFLTDGVVEARNASGELLGFDKMAVLATKAASETADAAQRWGQEDDITVLSVIRTGALQL